ncbi:phage protein NinX family protein [Citrobacter braakii]|uniref:phage protein NinX family protein n=1 Tax=Citrobacter braakii TaxID=57706 RepID=UPI0034E48641
MDYSKLSDKEINKLVAFALGCKEVVPDIFMDDIRRYEFDKPKNKSGNKFYFDPCNNPADAWPIIKDNMISLCAYKRENPGMKEVSWWEADNFCEHITRDDNPLRAAMIVFLMMQDSANVPANSTGSDLR